MANDKLVTYAAAQGPRAGWSLATRCSMSRSSPARRCDEARRSRRLAGRDRPPRRGAERQTDRAREPAARSYETVRRRGGRRRSSAPAPIYDDMIEMAKVQNIAPSPIRTRSASIRDTSSRCLLDCGSRRDCDAAAPIRRWVRLGGRAVAVIGRPAKDVPLEQGARLRRRLHHRQRPFGARLTDAAGRSPTARCSNTTGRAKEFRQRLPGRPWIVPVENIRGPADVSINCG